METCQHCSELKSTWDGKLKQSGFEDAEKNKLLKRWTGAPMEIHFERRITRIIDVVQVQEPNEPIKSNFPEINFAIEEDLFNNPQFEEICICICKHGNNVLTAIALMSIWRSYCDGVSIRQIAKNHDADDETVRRAILKLKEASKLWK